MRNPMQRLACLLALLAHPLAAQDPAAVELKSEKMGEGVWMITGQGGNIGVCAGKDGVLLIDDQFAPLTAKVKEAVKALSDKPIRFLINTHWHGDHTGGNENFGRAGVLIVAHENVRKRMSVEQFQEAFGRKTPPAPEAALPVVTFAESVTFHYNDEEIHAFHMPPAHTDGDSAIRFRKANVLHMGDLFFNGMYPFIDLSSGGSVDGVIGAADRILEMTDEKTRIIPGHGPAATRADLEAYRAVLSDVRDRVAKLLDEGKSVAEVVAARPSSDYDEKWGKGFMKPDKFVEIVATDLAAGRSK
ncbi:MAG: MBL fold metallo-hydrolase [Planctomycetota bacterium]